MKKAILTFGLFSLMMVLTSFTSVAEIGGQNAPRTPNGVAPIGGQNAPRTVFEIGGQNAPRTITAVEIGDESTPAQPKTGAEQLLPIGIGGQNAPRTMAEIGGQNAPRTPNGIAPIGGQNAPRTIV